MKYSSVKSKINQGVGTYKQALAEHPAAVIYSISHEGPLSRFFPTPYARERTDRHQRRAVREALGMLNEDPLVAYGAFKQALEKDMDVEKAVVIAYATGIDNDLHAMEVLDRSFAKKEGRKSKTQLGVEARKFEKSEAVKRAKQDCAIQTGSICAEISLASEGYNTRYL